MVLKVLVPIASGRGSLFILCPSVSFVFSLIVSIITV